MVKLNELRVELKIVIALDVVIGFIRIRGNEKIIDIFIQTLIPELTQTDIWWVVYIPEIHFWQ